LKNNLAEGIPELEKNVTTCQFGKQTRLLPSQSDWGAMRRLQLIHTDLGGPFPKPSLNGGIYTYSYLFFESGSVDTKFQPYISFNQNAHIYLIEISHDHYFPLTCLIRAHSSSPSASTQRS